MVEHPCAILHNRAAASGSARSVVWSGRGRIRRHCACRPPPCIRIICQILPAPPCRCHMAGRMGSAGVQQLPADQHAGANARSVAHLSSPSTRMPPRAPNWTRGQPAANFESCLIEPQASGMAMDPATKIYECRVRDSKSRLAWLCLALPFTATAPSPAKADAHAFQAGSTAAPAGGLERNGWT